MTCFERVLVLLGACAVSGCASERRDASSWVEEMHAIHAAADRSLERGDRSAARKTLETGFTAPVPGTVHPTDAGRVRRDLSFRLASVELEDGHAEAALAWAERGLALPGANDVFKANLLLAKGQALDALGRDAEAVEQYSHALRLNETLLNQALEDEPRKGS